MLSKVALHWRKISLSLLGVITVLSLIPLPEMPSAGGDKLHHYVGYFTVAFPLGLSLIKRWWLWGLSFIIWSGAIELIQPFVNRNCELLDFVANAVGIVSGLLVGILVHKLLLIQNRV